ncbi:hypothetical protein BR93DRAFT_333855 [Coniochaeta sp. PMI_546]|nr:hypothetical protein BR93DRAFT_333855 [Coniochaeta sp. PMI_546]
MAVQLPSEVIGPAAGILAYSAFCLICSLFLLWLLCVHNERTSYVAILSFFVSLNCLASIIQQIHSIVAWNDVKTDQYHYVVTHVGNPEIVIAGPSQGLDLALFYVQNYTYNVDALIVLFWAMELTQSVYRLRTLKQMGKYTSLGAKMTAILLPVLQVALLKTKAVQSSTSVFLFLTNFIIAISVTCGCLLLLLILYKYIHTRRAFMPWNVGYGDKSGSSGGAHTRSSQGYQRQPRSIYDRWLVIRFTIAFGALFIFEMFTIYFQVRSANNNKAENVPAQPDLSASKALGDFVLFIPGASEGFLAFLVFGTTRTFRDYTMRLLMPKKFWAGKRVIKIADGEPVRPQIRTQSSRESLRNHDTESGQGTPTTPRYEVGIHLHDIDGDSGQTRNATKVDDEWSIMTKVVEPPRIWYTARLTKR